MIAHHVNHTATALVEFLLGTDRVQQVHIPAVVDLKPTLGAPSDTTAPTHVAVSYARLEGGGVKCLVIVAMHMYSSNPRFCLRLSSYCPAQVTAPTICPRGRYGSH